MALKENPMNKKLQIVSLWVILLSFAFPMTARAQSAMEQAVENRLSQIRGMPWEQRERAVQAICERVGRSNPPAAHRPSQTEAEALKGCNSVDLYYGIGMNPDYVKARQCAFIEVGDGGTPYPKVFGGPVTLMQIYANGHGVPRNPDLATAYACENITLAPAERVGRILHLESLKDNPGTFDYCDDITSGFMQGFCTSLDSEREAAVRDAKLAQLVAGLPDVARQLHATMKKSFDAFVEARGAGEVDLSGTARAALVIEEKERMREQFLDDLGRLLSGQWPAADAESAKVADAALNANYRKALAWADDKDSNYSTIESEGIRTAERAWLKYRDDYVRFAVAAAPKLSRDAVLARLTSQRDDQLRELFEGE
jgi:uncharacterized protein YecT (DUF1311 family)